MRQISLLEKDPTESVFIAWPAVDARNVVVFLRASRSSSSHSVLSSLRIGSTIHMTRVVLASKRMIVGRQPMLSPSSASESMICPQCIVKLPGRPVMRSPRSRDALASRGDGAVELRRPAEVEYQTADILGIFRGPYMISCRTVFRRRRFA